MASSGGARISTTVPAFVDTNVAIYALGQDSDKKARAKQILDGAPIASSQVINEAISLNFHTSKTDNAGLGNVARSPRGGPEG